MSASFLDREEHRKQSEHEAREALRKAACEPEFLPHWTIYGELLAEVAALRTRNNELADKLVSAEQNLRECADKSMVVVSLLKQALAIYKP